VLTDGGRGFYERYRDRHERVDAAARLAERLVRQALADEVFTLHQVAGRAKDPTSLLRKMRDKEYDDPANEVTDLVGVRVISYFHDEVDAIVARLKDVFEVDDARSVDKREALSVREFGYRSVHLIVRAKELRALDDPGVDELAGLWFEIQVRSLLEHAWAEIEHDIVYKTGVAFPEDVLRRFAGLAAQMEQLDRDFLELREKRAELIADLRAEYAEGRGFDAPLDAARLCAVLEVLRPGGYSFRAAEEQGTALLRGSELSCVKALGDVGIVTGAGLAETLATEAVGEKVERYASLEGVSSDEVSHFAVCVLTASARDPERFERDYPDLLSDAVLRRSMRPEEP
jgi:ppGpp synthetase/RelA/SpoT-type nucleotidyltranferase